MATKLPNGWENIDSEGNKVQILKDDNKWNMIESINTGITSYTAEKELSPKKVVETLKEWDVPNNEISVYPDLKPFCIQQNDTKSLSQ